MNYLLVVINIFSIIALILSTFICLLFALYLLKLHKNTKAVRVIQQEKAIVAAKDANNQTWAVILNQLKKHEQQRDKQ